MSEPTQRPRKAVTPVAGLGTRFLPATKAVPKELLPVVDRPAVESIVEEAVRAGLTDALLEPAKADGEGSGMTGVVFRGRRHDTGDRLDDFVGGGAR